MKLSRRAKNQERPTPKSVGERTARGRLQRLVRPLERWFTITFFNDDAHAEAQLICTNDGRIGVDAQSDEWMAEKLEAVKYRLNYFNDLRLLWREGEISLSRPGCRLGPAGKQGPSPHPQANSTVRRSAAIRTLELCGARSADKAGIQGQARLPRRRR